MPENDDVMNDDSLPVSDHLADFNLPDFESEVAVWKTRCHELWHDSRAAGDLRAQAQAIGAAIRSLENWARSIEAQQTSSAASMSQEEKDRIIREHDDEIVRRVEAVAAPFGGWVSCPSKICKGGYCPKSVHGIISGYLGRNQEVDNNGNNNVTGD